MVRQTVTAWVVRDGFAEWTTLRVSKGGVERVGGGRWTFTPEKDFAEHLRQERPLPPLPYVVSVPSSRVLARVADLPSVDPSERAGMVELQIDKLSPYPVDQMVFSAEILHEEEAWSRVAMVAMESAARETLAEPFRAVDRLPVRIDAEPLVWWTAVQAAGDGATDGRRMHLLLHPGGADLIVADDGQPVLFRLLLTRPADAAEDIPWPAEDMVEELDYSMRAVEADWGARALSAVTVWHHGEIPSALLHRLQVQLGRPPLVRRLDELPPPSEALARRALADDPVRRLNLADQAWIQAVQTRRLRKRLGLSALALAAVWLVAVGALVGMEKWHKERLVSAKAELAAAQAEAKEVRQIRDRVESLRQYGDRQRSALECLREICAVLPDGLELSQFTYHKNNRLSFRGFAPDAQAGRIYDFSDAIGKSAVLGKVEKLQENVVSRGGERKREFSATVALAAAPAAGGGAPK